LEEKEKNICDLNNEIDILKEEVASLKDDENINVKKLNNDIS
jgi:hypothetical protein